MLQMYAERETGAENQRNCYRSSVGEFSESASESVLYPYWRQNDSEAFRASLFFGRESGFQKVWDKDLAVPKRVRRVLQLFAPLNVQRGW